MKVRAYGIAINPKYDGCQRGLASMVYKFFDKKRRFGANVGKSMPSLKIGKSMPSFWAADLAEMGSLSSKNRGVKYLLCANLLFFTKYAWVKPL